MSEMSGDRSFSRMPNRSVRNPDSDKKVEDYFNKPLKKETPEEELSPQERAAHIAETLIKLQEYGVSDKSIERIGERLIESKKTHKQLDHAREAMIQRLEENRAKQARETALTPPPLPPQTPPPLPESHLREAHERRARKENENLRRVFNLRPEEGSEPIVPGNKEHIPLANASYVEDLRHTFQKKSFIPSPDTAKAEVMHKFAPSAAEIAQRNRELAKTGLFENLSHRIEKWWHGPEKPIDVLQMRLLQNYPESKHNPSHWTKSLARAIETESEARKKVEKELGFVDRINQISDWYQKNFTRKQRMAISIGLAATGAVSFFALPVLLSAIAPAAFAARVGSAAIAGVAVGKFTHGYFENTRDVEYARKVANKATGLVFLLALVGGKMAGASIDAYFDGGTVSKPIASAATIDTSPARVFTIADVVPDAEVKTINVPPVSVVSEAVPASDVLAPSMPAVDAYDPPTIKEIGNLWSFVTDTAKESLGLQNADSFSKAIHRVIDEMNLKGTVIENNGTGLSSDISWNKLPNEATVHLDRLFENEEFKSRLAKKISSNYTTLAKEVGNIDTFIKHAAETYGARS